MSSETTASTEHNPRETVRFYLHDHETWLGKAVDVVLLVLNLVFVGIIVVETYPLTSAVETLLWDVEVAVVLVFSVEYVFRIYGAKNRLAELFDPYTLVDLVTILPTLLVLVSPLSAFGGSIVFVRVLRAIRVLRFYRFTQDERFFFGTISVATLRALKLLLTVLVLLFVSAGLFYSFEHGQNPEVDTFGDAFYFTVVSLSTVGFGDIVPVTDAGRWVTVGSVLAGIILIPWQASRIVKEWTNRELVNITCPNCGLEYHDPDASHCKACGHVIYQEHDSRD